LRLVNNNFKTVADGIENKLGRTIIFDLIRLENYVNSEPYTLKIGWLYISFLLGHARYQFSYYKKSTSIPTSYSTEYIHYNGVRIKSVAQGLNISDVTESNQFSYYPAENAGYGWKGVFLPDILATSYLLSKHRYSDNSVFICESLKKTLNYYLNCIKCDESITKNRDEVLLWYQSELWPNEINESHKVNI
jgi:hypothetical protein